MEPIRTGRFIAQLRREAGLTQEALGEKLGVTNKTISRWENGNYMPDIAALQTLAGVFGVNLDELLAGRRLQKEKDRQQTGPGPAQPARQARSSAFTRQEQAAYWSRKWLREHRARILLLSAGLAGLCVWAGFWGHPVVLGACLLAGLAAYGWLNNDRMAYIERNLYR